eukprot:COSAG01_NODE_20546_length_948_cov_1.359246_1_plen_126_part_00
MRAVLLINQRQPAVVTLTASSLLNAVVQTEPLVTLPTAEEGAGYVVMMVDGTNSARHWALGNVPGSALQQGFRNENTTRGLTILSPYYGPHPPPSSATDPYHVYGQFVFKQPRPTMVFVRCPDDP